MIFAPFFSILDIERFGFLHQIAATILKIIQGQWSIQLLDSKSTEVKVRICKTVISVKETVKVSFTGWIVVELVLYRGENLFATGRKKSPYYDEL
jgi:hypothetical protein